MTTNRSYTNRAEHPGLVAMADRACRLLSYNWKHTNKTQRAIASLWAQRDNEVEHMTVKQMRSACKQGTRLLHALQASGEYVVLHQDATFENGRVASAVPEQCAAERMIPQTLQIDRGVALAQLASA